MSATPRPTNDFVFIVNKELFNKQYSHYIAMLHAQVPFWEDEGYNDHMTKSLLVGGGVVVMIALIVGVDVLYFRNHFWERLMANAGIVLVFAAFALRFLR